MHLWFVFLEILNTFPTPSIYLCFPLHPICKTFIGENWNTIFRAISISKLFNTQKNNFLKQILKSFQFLKYFFDDSVVSELASSSQLSSIIEQTTPHLLNIRRVSISTGNWNFDSFQRSTTEFSVEVSFLSTDNQSQALTLTLPKVFERILSSKSTVLASLKIQIQSIKLRTFCDTSLPGNKNIQEASLNTHSTAQNGSSKKPRKTKRVNLTFQSPSKGRKIPMSLLL